MPRRRLTSTKRKLLTLTARIALRSLATAFITTAAMHDHGRVFRKTAIRQWEHLGYDLASVANCLKYLRRCGYIEEFVEGKRGTIELTRIGQRRLLRYGLSVPFLRPRRWDGKWRIVIYDIPDRESGKRRMFRYYLTSIGFLPLQESVYIFPFECTHEVRAAAREAQLTSVPLILIAEALDGEKELIAMFIQQRILTKEHVKTAGKEK